MGSTLLLQHNKVKYKQKVIPTVEIIIFPAPELIIPPHSTSLAYSYEAVTVVKFTFSIKPGDCDVDLLDEPHVLLHGVVQAVAVGHGQEALVGHEGGDVGGAGGENG